MIYKLNKYISEYFSFSWETLGYARILYGTTLFGFFSWWYWISMDNLYMQIPQYLFDPPKTNIIYYFLPAPWFFTASGWILFICCICIVTGIYTKIASFVWSIIMIVLTGISYSYGKIGHDLILLITPAILSLTNWWSYISWQRYMPWKRESVENWPIILLLLCFFFWFFSAWLEKIVDLRYLNPHVHVISNYIPAKNHELFNMLWGLKGIFLESLDYGAIILEVFLPVLVWFGRKALLVFCLIAVLFGLMNVYLMGITHYGVASFYIFYLIAKMVELRGKHICTIFVTVWGIIQLICILNFMNNRFMPNIFDLRGVVKDINNNFFYIMLLYFYIYLIIAEIKIYFPKKNPNDGKNRKIIFYDGECGFCNHFIAFILKQNNPNLYFCSQQSEIWRSILLAHNIVSQNASSIYFLDNEKVYSKLDAIQKIFKNLNWFLKILSICISFVPLNIANSIYDYIASHRKKLFKLTYCYLPTWDQKNHMMK